LIYLAAGHGLQAVAATQFITGPLQVYVALWFIRRHVAFGWSEFARPLLTSGVVALCAAAPAAAVIAAEGFPHDVSFATASLAGAAAAAGWLCGLFATAHPLVAELRSIGSQIWPTLSRPVQRLGAWIPR
jgi:lipopolysaccharide exporter